MIRGVDIMDIKETKLLLQTHPLKIFIDWMSRYISLYFLWDDKIGLTLLVILGSSILSSYLILKYIDITALKDTAYGKIMPSLMTIKLEIARSVIFVVAVAGAWLQNLMLIMVSFFIIIFIWMIGFS